MICGIVCVVVLMALHLYDGMHKSRQILAVLSSSFTATSLSKVNNATDPSLRNGTATERYKTEANQRRVVVLEGSFPDDGWNASDGLTEQEKTQTFYFDMPPATRSAAYRFVHDKDLTAGGGCDYMEEWQRQTIARPTCNVLHEVSIRMGESEPSPHSAIMEPLGKGSLKQVWSIHEKGDFHRNVLLKTSRNMKSSNDADMQYADAKEALIMDQCTSTRHVVGIHGWCYQSSLVEKADGGLLEWVETNIFDPVRHNEGKILPEISNRIVRVAIALTKGLADMQLIRYEGDLPKVVHGDIKLEQFHYKRWNDTDVGLDVTIQLGDFNWALLLTSNVSLPAFKNRTDIHQSVCSFPETKSHRTVSRSPEEFTKGSPLTDKIDLSTLASLFFWLLTSDNVYAFDYSNATDTTSAYVEGSKIPRAKAKQMIRAGLPPSFPYYLTQSRDENIKAMLRVILACKLLDPMKRPMPREIISFLQRSLAKVERI